MTAEFARQKSERAVTEAKVKTLEEAYEAIFNDSACGYFSSTITVPEKPVVSPIHC